MKYWLMKSEPNAYSIDHLKKDKITCWDGVRNYQARNFMRDEMKPGDLVFFYHSNCKAVGIVGIAEVVKNAYTDHTAFDPDDHHFDPKSNPDNPRWVMVDIKFKQKFKTVIALPELRQNPKLKDMLILRKGNRLSITPLTKNEWDAIMIMSR
jgi:predicted RNA-binding protein with PUA-like domain